MTVRLAWATDIHLNFLTDDEVRSFCRSIIDVGSKAFIVSGDIAEAPTLQRYLHFLEEHLGIPIYFVLGNHDFYRGNIVRVRRRIVELAAASENLTYLTAVGPVELTPSVGLLGHDGWADARLGDYASSTVLLNDYMLIDELSGLTAKGRELELNKLGDEAAAHFREHLPSALKRFQQLYIITHVPPFREAVRYQGGVANDDWLPHFSCGAVGEVLLQMLEGHIGCDVTVLCGHTHSRGVTRILPNLLVRTGAAEYHKPCIEEIIEL